MTNPKPTAEKKDYVIEKRICKILEIHGVNPIDAFNSTPDLITLLASEVECVIEERMPSEEERDGKANAYSYEEDERYFDEIIAEHFKAGWNACIDEFRNQIKGKQ